MEGQSLRVSRVSVRYGEVTILDEVSLDIEAGEFVALLGASGCGKTTLLRAISGFARVTGGEIRIGGREVTRTPPERRNTAMVFQSYALWPHMSAADNIGYGLKLRGVAAPERRARVEQVLALLGLAGLGRRRISQLSGGQRQRVALGRALAVDPTILLLDEPLSNLDARIRQTVRHEIKSLQESLGITTVHVTHDREEAMVMADRIAIMNAGRIVQVGAPESVYNRPESAFVAGFMGADNVVPLEVALANGGVAIGAGPHNDAAVLPLAGRGSNEGARFSPACDGEVAAHFRAEAARLVVDAAPPPDSLVLQGRIAQRSYPGGSYRYAIAVGSSEYLVDDARSLDPGTMVGLCLPAAALHLFPHGEQVGEALAATPAGRHHGMAEDRPA